MRGLCPLAPLILQYTRSGSQYIHLGGTGVTYDRESLLVDLSGELKMNTSKDRAHLSMNLHRPSDLSDDINEMTSLEGCVRLGGLGVAVLTVSS